MSTLFGCLVRLCVVAAVCLALFAGVLWFAGGNRAAPSPIVAVSTVAPVAPAADVPTATPDANAAATARAKLAAADHTATSAPPGSHQLVTITLSEAEVNAIAVPELESQANFPLQQPSVQILPGQVILNGQAAFGPTTLPIAVTGSVDVQGGVPTLTVLRVQAGGISAPQSIVNQVRNQIATSLRLTPADLPITVQQVTLGSHTLTVMGATK
jgi:hypothetical protein